MPEKLVKRTIVTEEFEVQDEDDADEEQDVEDTTDEDGEEDVEEAEAATPVRQRRRK